MRTTFMRLGVHRQKQTSPLGRQGAQSVIDVPLAELAALAKSASGVHMRTLFERVAQFHGGSARSSIVAVAASVIGSLGLTQAQAAETIYLKPSVGTITYADQTENLRGSGANGCVLNTATLTLLTFAGTGTGVGPVGYNTRDRLIGVNGTASGSPCTQIRIGQGVQVGLGSQFQVNETKLLSATIGLKASPKATVRIQTFRGAATPVHDRDNLVCVRDCSFALDGTNDLDTTTTQPKQWDYVVITSKTGSSSSESGAFSLRDSQFVVSFVPEGALNCDPSSPDNSAVDYAVDSDTTTNKVVLRRLPDVGSASTDCTSIPYRLDFDGQFSEFLADYSALPPGAQPAFEWKAEWDPEEVAVPLVAALEVPVVEDTFAGLIPLTLQRFLATDPQYAVDLCVGTPQYDTNDTADESDDLLLNVSLVSGVDYDMSSLPGTQYGCYLKRKVTVLSPTPVACPDGQCVPYQVIESGYVRGDWVSTRTLR
jgi:hypothetical protein